MVRYGAKSSPAEVVSVDVGSGTAELRFETPQRAPAKGQAAVLYSADELIGGGRIAWAEA
jgi:tRNA U34 2-thiouridine synthase MnmA/TrmU